MQKNNVLKALAWGLIFFVSTIINRFLLLISMALCIASLWWGPKTPPASRRSRPENKSIEDFRPESARASTGERRVRFGREVKTQLSSPRNKLPPRRATTHV